MLPLSRPLFLGLLLTLPLAGCPQSGRGGGGGDSGNGDLPSVEEVLPVDAKADLESELAADLGLDAAEVAPEVAVEPVDPTLGAALQVLLDEYRAFSGQVGTTLALETGDGRWWAGATGLRSLQDVTPMEPDTRFRVGSGTKPYVAALLLLLAEEGLVDLDAPITDYLPQYPQWSKVNTRQLLGMEAGLPDYLVVMDLWIEALAKPGQPVTPEKLLSYVADEPLEYEPGQGCAYSNTNYVLAGLIAQAVTGNPVEQELKTRILDPLQLDSTFLDSSGDEWPFLSHGYLDPEVMSFTFGVSPAMIALLPEELFVDDLLDCTWLFHPTSSWAAGAMVSNTRDMIRFMQALLSGKLLGEDSLAQMKAFHKCELLGGIVDYGLGLMEYGTALGPAYGHGGLNFGYESNTMVVPGKGISLSHMHNLLPEQSWALAAGALDLLSAGPPETTAPACVPPEGFLDGDGGPHLEFRYSGVVSADTDPLPAPGMVHAVAAFVEDSHVPLYGLASTALLKKSAFQTRVDFQTVGPGADPEYPLVAASVSATTALLASDGTDTELDLATMPAYTLFAATVKIRIDPVTSKADRFCFTGVPQAQSPGRLFRCGTSAGKVEVGQRVKLFASVPLTSDPLAIADYVDVLKMAVCMCIQDNGTWAVCTD